MSMPPDLEKQQPPEDSGGHISENSDDTKAPVSPEVRSKSPSPQDQEITAPEANVGCGSKRAPPTRKTTFGLKKASNEPFYDPVAATYDYTKKYKPDPMFHEAAENARVWHVYNDEAAIFDTDMIEEASDGLDILLVFAGLFSAVLTTFLIQTSQSLRPDNSGLTVALLQELVDLQRAQAKGISLETIPQVKSDSPSGIDKWINGLWFASLTLSLSSALLAVLVKQWLRYYGSRTTGSPRARALIRQSRHDGFKKWQVQPIIGVLPTILHVALFVFLIGLVLFLTTLDTTISIVIGAMTVLLLAIYVVSIALPVIMLHCPYRTPIGELIHRLLKDERSFKWQDGYNIPRRVNSAHTALVWLYDETSNQSVRPIVAESVPAVWRSEYESKSLTTPRTKMGCLPITCFYHLHHQFPKDFLINLPKLENGIGDWTQFSQEESKKLQRGLLYLVIYHQEFQVLSFDGVTPEKVPNNEITALSSDPVLGLLALSIGFSVRFKRHGEIDSVDNTMSVESKKPFTWLLKHHSKLAMPKLHPGVWKRLQEREGWNVEGITLQNISADLEVVIKEPMDLHGRDHNPPSHQPMSLASFVRRNLTYKLLQDSFGGNSGELDEWLKQPVVRANDDGGGLENTDGNEGVSLEGQATHSRRDTT